MQNLFRLLEVSRVHWDRHWLMQRMQKTEVAWLQDFFFKKKKTIKIGPGTKDLGTEAYLPCSLGAIEPSLRLGERRTIKLRVCSSFMC